MAVYLSKMAATMVGSTTLYAFVTFVDIVSTIES